VELAGKLAGGSCSLASLPDLEQLEYRAERGQWAESVVTSLEKFAADRHSARYGTRYAVWGARRDTLISFCYVYKFTFNTHTTILVRLKRVHVL